MLLFPFLGWLAIWTSGVTLVLLCRSGEVGGWRAVVVAAAILLAGYAQFFGASAAAAATGLGVQTLVAVYLVVRWRLTE